MAVRIQLRRDTAANWIASNPVLRAGEFGVETDTLKVKVGNGSSNWNSITDYLNVVPTELSNYIATSQKGSANGVASLDASSNLIVPGSSIIIEGATPDSYELTLVATDPTDDRTITLPDATGTVALTSNIPSTTDGLNEGSTNKYFTDERAQDAAASALNAGTHTNITVTYDDNAGSISLAAAPGYTDEQAQDAVAAALAAGTHTNITVTYNDNANSISLAAAPGYTDENAQDAVGNAVGNGLDYDDSTGAISVDPSEFALSSVGAPTSDVSMATYKITNLGSPTQATDAATKAYVDSVSEGLHIHEAVHAATTGSLASIIGDTVTYDNGTDGVGATLTLASPMLDLDGHTLNNGDRILVKNESNTAHNGIYSRTSSTVLTRATDFDSGAEIAGGDFVFVENGTAYNSTGWVLENEVTTVGTDSIIWVQFSGAGTYLAGNGLTLTGTTFSINTGTTADLSTAQTLTNKTITGTFTGNITGDVTGNVTGNAGTVTNGVYTTGSYSDPAWITSLAASKVGLGNVENTALSTWAGSTNITTLGTIGTGTWNATAIGTTKGGTGLTSYATGDIIYASASNTLSKLAAGATGYLLTMDSAGIPVWAAAPISLPSQTGNAGKYLTTDGTTASWGTLVVPITTGTATLNTNTAQIIDSFVTNPGVAVEYFVTMRQGTKIRTSKVLVHTDSNNVDMTEFAIMELNGQMSGVAITASINVSSGYLNAVVTDAASTNVIVKFSKVAL